MSALDGAQTLVERVLSLEISLAEKQRECDAAQSQARDLQQIMANAVNQAV
jgi:hypothetical protein